MHVNVCYEGRSTVYLVRLNAVPVCSADAVVEASASLLVREFRLSFGVDGANAGGVATLEDVLRGDMSVSLLTPATVLYLCQSVQSYRHTKRYSLARK